MRMKKILILAATVALSAACSQTYEVAPVAKDAGQIAFGSWSDGLTRADDPHLTTDWVSGDTFAVYGAKEDNTDNAGDPISPATVTSVFTGQEVSYNGTLWDYSNHRFWDVNCEKYTFYAISPAAVGAAATVTPATGEISSGSVTFAGDDNDILVADKKEVLRGSTPATYFNTFGTVPLVFNHIASLVDVKIKKTSTITATVAVTSVSLTNIDATGTFSVDADYDNTHWGGTAGPNVTWSPTARGTYTNANSVGGPATLPTDVTAVATIDNTTATDGDAIITNLVVMPQTMRNDENIQTLNITYTITPTGGDVTTYTANIPLHTFDTDYDTTNDAAWVTAWEMAKHYTYYVTIDAHAIMFSATINDWTAATGYHYLMN